MVYTVCKVCVYFDVKIEPLREKVCIYFDVKIEPLERGKEKNGQMKDTLESGTIQQKFLS